ncbi:hypothetical protein BDP55DRAFT_642544 [Colletotrichum godetiae]|uniref:Uncharacterized protein n=1 Tax=Colletotrichum godetiae TaxID=1209918 RepID=A0AAJ0EZP7_9PEZI|nr:uncharacterized protein BDP55DRAFT_642544 [Colletotrichum godetiae]KAK1700333.1 hypothetical protein BDP55DRAFT_642544 [Colletotrichum godetiae]
MAGRGCAICDAASYWRFDTQKDADGVHRSAALVHSLTPNFKSHPIFSFVLGVFRLLRNIGVTLADTCPLPRTLFDLHSRLLCVAAASRCRLLGERGPPFPYLFQSCRRRPKDMRKSAERQRLELHLKVKECLSFSRLERGSKLSSSPSPALVLLTCPHGGPKEKGVRGLDSLRGTPVLFLKSGPLKSSSFESLRRGRGTKNREKHQFLLRGNLVKPLPHTKVFDLSQTFQELQRWLVGSKEKRDSRQTRGRGGGSRLSQIR